MSNILKKLKKPRPKKNGLSQEHHKEGNWVQLGPRFIAEKTSDEFQEVVFSYDFKKWEGAIPIKLRYQGFDARQRDECYLINYFYPHLNFQKHENWKINAQKKWENQTTQTYKVFKALLSGEWECRVCGPVPKVNPQAASRIRDIKKCGFIIASKRKSCERCNKKQMHDLLIMANLPNEITKPELRKPITPELVERIMKVLKLTECVFDQTRTKKELIIDHKFPSQRWLEPESDNNMSMTDDEICDKFQLLSNQTNMLKSRECDRCVKDGLRGQFLGIPWYYEGDELWSKEFSDPDGCIGCPWFDIGRWKRELIKKTTD